LFARHKWEPPDSQCQGQIPVTDLLDEKKRIVKGATSSADVREISMVELARATSSHDGCVRGMPSIAAGRVTKLVTDEDGVIVHARITDTGEWQKILARLYTAFVFSIEPVEGPDGTYGFDLKMIFLSDSSPDAGEMERADRHGGLAKDAAHKTHQTPLHLMREALKNPARISHGATMSCGRPKTS
jgi:hypothetical protein